MRDEAGYRELFLAEYPRLVRELTLLVGDRPLAEDLAADAFEQLLRRWTRVSRYERPAAWVRMVAIRGAARARHRRGRRPAVEASYTGSRSEPPVDLDLLAALAELPMSQRAAVVLHHLGGLPAAEVAGVLGCSEVTVRTHLLRGRRRLAQLLELTLDDEEVADAEQ